ncbi:hypothetical protein [Yersinia aleksiciae]|uniref:hypothetical protein n=1 Tax=Yersinia aleksiciae TaxID=263819 RepID=UPI00119DA812|nr:hypothetical protein [Yersinia aleksiciae]
MNNINNQAGNAHSDINSTQFPEDNTAVKVNEGHLDRILSDLETIRSKNKESISQLNGHYQENSDGSFHSYATEEASANGINQVRIYIEAQYSSGSISGYHIRYTEFDTTGNILGYVESQLDANGTTLDYDHGKSGMQRDIIAEPTAEIGGVLAESINSFPLQGVDIDISNTFITSNIRYVATLSSTVIGIYL